MKTKKHLGLKLDGKLSFREQLKDKFPIVNKGIGMLKKFSNYLSRHSLVTHLDDADIIYDMPDNMNIFNKI